MLLADAEGRAPVSDHELTPGARGESRLYVPQVLEGNPDCMYPLAVHFWEKDRCYPSSEDLYLFAMEVPQGHT